MSKQGYKPAITVVGKPAFTSCGWLEEGSNYPNAERAYLVRGLPMPGERVADEYNEIRVVSSLLAGVKMVDGGQFWTNSLLTLTPYDPEAEKVERVARALYGFSYCTGDWDTHPSREAREEWRDRARQVIAAMEDE